MCVHVRVLCVVCCGCGHKMGEVTFIWHCAIFYGGHTIGYILLSSLITLDHMRSPNELPSYVTHYFVFYWWNSSRNKKKCHSWANFLYKRRPHTAKIPAQTSLCRSKIERAWLAIERQWSAIIVFSGTTLIEIEQFIS